MDVQLHTVWYVLFSHMLTFETRCMLSLLLLLQAVPDTTCLRLSFPAVGICCSPFVSSMHYANRWTRWLCCGLIGGQHPAHVVREVSCSSHSWLKLVSTKWSGARKEPIVWAADKRNTAHRKATFETVWTKHANRMSQSHAGDVLLHITQISSKRQVSSLSPSQMFWSIHSPCFTWKLQAVDIFTHVFFSGCFF